MASIVKIRPPQDGWHLPTVLRGHTSPFPPAVDLRSGVTASGSRGGTDRHSLACSAPSPTRKSAMFSGMNLIAT